MPLPPNAAGSGYQYSEKGGLRCDDCGLGIFVIGHRRLYDLVEDGVSKKMLCVRCHPKI